MVFLLRVVWLIFLILFLRWLFSKLFAAGASRISRHMEPPPAQVHGTAHKDPQCGIYIADELAVLARSGAETHYFCSIACRDQYLEEQRGTRTHTD